MHSGNGPHEEMNHRAVACFEQALADVGLGEDHPVRAVLRNYFTWATFQTMNRYERSPEDVPDGLRIPRWSWSGLVEGS
jgi:hemoglobin